MRFELNMATQPFRRSRSTDLFLGFAITLLAITAALMISTYVQQYDLPPELTIRQSQLQQDLARLSADDIALREILEHPSSGNVFERSIFLNRLLQRKGISWTKTFADLEYILPSRVQVMQIRPEVTDSNDVVLSMQVGAETPKDFISFLKKLEGSNLFDSPNLRGSAPPNDNQPLFRYQLTVSYEQQL